MMDPAIKLFGKTIPVIGEGDGEESMRYDSNDSSYSEHQELDDKELAEYTMEIEQSDDTTPRSEEDSTNPPAMQSAKNNEKPADSEKESEEKESDDLKNPQQKPLKKPDKILPCPRCNSLDTKFCYYNNYNINQPRHFCKSCQRYWTAGGTMRNVPVGAGRRKNKSSASRYCHITVSEALQAARLDIPNGVHHHPGLKSNGTVLTFGSDNPLCESMAPVLNIGDHNSNNNNNKKAPKNGFHKIDQGYCRSKETGCDDRSSRSTITTTSSMDDKVKVGPQGQIKPNNMNNNNGFTTNQMPCFQWPYMWNPAVPMPPFCPSAPFPMSFYPHPPPPPPPPPPYWNGAMPWNFPWVPQCSPNQKSPGSNPSSPTLGKHTREGEMVNQSYQEKSTVTPTVLVPKTLRIDDPDEAAKSSIWSTLGIKKGDSLSKGGFFNSLPPKKGEEKIHNMDTPTALKANPAALCRSMNFQERA